MDFKDILGAEISAKRKLLDEEIRGSGEGGERRKYIKRSDILAAEAHHNEKEEQEQEQEKVKETTLSEATAASTDTSVNEEEKIDMTDGKEDHQQQEEPSVKSAKLEKEELLVDPMETDKISAATFKEDPTLTRQNITLFLLRLLHHQKTNLSTQPEEYQNSKEGKQAFLINTQSQQHLKPFLRLLRKNALPGDVMQAIINICECLQQREYVKANNIYLRLAIGNAPWPIGVTNVGIHERSAQEKIKSNQVAHVLNDEVSRKWIQAIKRLMTYCQSLYPNSDRTKMMG